MQFSEKGLERDNLRSALWHDRLFISRQKTDDWVVYELSIVQRVNRFKIRRPFPSCLYLCIKTSSYENVFHRFIFMQITHFHMKGSARRLVLKQRHKITWKWFISNTHLYLARVRFKTGRTGTEVLARRRTYSVFKAFTFF